MPLSATRSPSRSRRVRFFRFLQLAAQNASADEAFIAIYADEEVPYGKIVEVLDLGARNNLKMVLLPVRPIYVKAAYTGPESSTKL